MASYNNNRNSGTDIGQHNKGFFNRLLRNVTNWGMDFDDMILRNAVAVGKDQSATIANNGGNDPMYDFFARTAASSAFSRKAISYLDTTYPEKKRILREYSRKDEIRDFITIVCDESIVYDEDTDFLIPINLPEEFDENVKKKHIENFHSIYARLGFNDGTVAWNYFRTLIVDGFLAFEIIYDDKQRDIVGFQELDSTTLVPGIEPMTGDKIWIQYPEQPEMRRILLDSQIIYISYSNGTELSETSYVENLIRPYNQLKLLEQTRIMFNITNAMIYKQFNIPVAGMSKSVAEEQIAKMIANYKDEISWNDDFGIVQINGSPHIPYSKEYWFPQGEAGKPEVSLIQQQGHNLNEDDTTMVWFFNAMKRASRIPFTRFDKTNGGGNIFGDDSDVSRDEVTFFNFISRLRAVFKEIMIKPWKIKMVLDFPELKNDENFMQSINTEYNGVNLFHEWKKLNNLSKRAEILGTLSSSIQQADGTPYFHIEWLVREILKLDEETIQENNRWKKVAPNATAEGGGGMGGSMGGGDFSTGSTDFGGIDLGGGATDTTTSDTTDTGATDIEADTGGDDSFDF
jgi:hypothetical protein